MSRTSSIQRLVLPALLTLVTSAVVMGVHRQSVRTAVSAHGLLHTAIGNQFIEPAASAHPFENPFFAGESLSYYWVFQGAGARLGNALGMHPLRGMELLILGALAMLWFGAARLGNRLNAGRWSGFWIGFLAIAGTNAMGLGILLLKVTVGGGALPGDDGGYLWGIVDPMVGIARIGDPFNLYGPMVNFFLNITSRPIALSFTLLMAVAIWSWLDRRRTGSLAALAVAAAGATLMSPLVGLSAGLSLAGMLSALALPPFRGNDSDGPRTYFLPAAAIMAGILVASPTFIHLFQQAGEGGLTIGLRPTAVLGVGASILPLAVAAAIGFFRTKRTSERRYLTVIVGACVVLLCASVVTEIRASNDTNFFHAAAFLLAIPAASAFRHREGVRGWRRLLVPALGLAVFAPTSLLVVYAYLDRPDVPLVFQGQRLSRTPRDSPHAMLYQWVIDESEPDAVFVVDARRPLEAAMGNAPELPALTGRSLFVVDPNHYIVKPYEDVERRYDMSAKLLAGEALSPTDRAYLNALDRPIYVVSREADRAEVGAALIAAHGAPVFSRGPLAVFRVSRSAGM